MASAPDPATSTISRGGLVFLSYAREDEDLAMLLKSRLQAVGVRVWQDTDHLCSDAPDSVVQARIDEGLSTATDFVALVTPSAEKKRWVRHEREHAAARALVLDRPHIHLVVQESVLPELPHHSLSRMPDLAPLLAAITPLAPPAALDDDALAESVFGMRTDFLAGGSTAISAFHRFDRLWPQLAARVEAAAGVGFTGREARVGTWLRALGPVLDLRAPRAWLVQHTRAAALSHDVPAVDRSLLWNNVSVLYIFGGAWSRAAEAIRETVAACAALGDGLGMAIAENNRALLALEQRDPAAALVAVGRATEILDRENRAPSVSTDDPLAWSHLSIRGNLAHHAALAEAMRGRIDLARTRLARHLTIAEAIEDRRAIGIALGRLAWLDLVEGCFDAATDMALERYRRNAVTMLNPRGVANAIGWQAEAARMQGDLRLAARHLEHEIALREALEEQAFLARALARRIAIARATGLGADETKPWEARLQRALGEVEGNLYDDPDIRLATSR